MKSKAPCLADDLIVANPPNGFANWCADILVLAKARVNLLVVATTFVGFALHAGIRANWLLLANTLIGTGLVAGGAAAANQTLEWRFDRQMVRTKNRPIAAGRFSRRTGVVMSVIFLAAGCLWLGVAVNLPAMLFALLTFLIYVFAYTPLKRLNAVCVLVGAVAGALPVLIGWAATNTGFGWWAAVAFLTLFLWQIPHFLAIAWWCRADYTQAGYHVLPGDDARGYWTGGFALAFAFVTVAVSLTPVWAREASDFYLWGRATLGIAILFSSLRFLIRRSRGTARSLFVVSLFYLPLLFVLMLLGKK